MIIATYLNNLSLWLQILLSILISIIFELIIKKIKLYYLLRKTRDQQLIENIKKITKDK
jgi:hypothetical protein